MKAMQMQHIQTEKEKHQGVRGGALHGPTTKLYMAQLIPLLMLMLLAECHCFLQFQTWRMHLS